jgi:hypothetical protein
MAKNKTKPDQDLDRLKLENELRKIKLAQEKGAIFSDPSESGKLPPKIENEFLRNIEAFEKQYDTAEQVTVFEFIGRPDYCSADSISNDSMGKALEELMEVLNSNNIVLETDCDVDDRDLYIFITTELFFHEIDNIQLEGMTLNFIYEEFHPNHDYDIRNHSADFIHSFLDKDSDYYTTFLTKRAEEENDLLHFRESFSSFKLNHFKICTVSQNDQKAEVVFQADFSANIENSSEIVQFNGEGLIELLYQYDYWCVNRVKFPAM